MAAQPSAARRGHDAAQDDARRTGTPRDHRAAGGTRTVRGPRVAARGGVPYPAPWKCPWPWTHALPPPSDNSPGLRLHRTRRRGHQHTHRSPARLSRTTRPGIRRSDHRRRRSPAIGRTNRTDPEHSRSPSAATTPPQGSPARRMVQDRGSGPARWGRLPLLRRSPRRRHQTTRREHRHLGRGAGAGRDARRPGRGRDTRALRADRGRRVRGRERDTRKHADRAAGACLVSRAAPTPRRPSMRAGDRRPAQERRHKVIKGELRVVPSDAWDACT